jgi:hypothetical protein
MQFYLTLLEHATVHPNEPHISPTRVYRVAQNVKPPSTLNASFGCAERLAPFGPFQPLGLLLRVVLLQVSSSTTCAACEGEHVPTLQRCLKNLE